MQRLAPELLGFHRLGHEAFHAGGKTAFTIILESVGGHGDNGQMLAAGQLQDLTGRFDAVDLGHPEVREDHVRLLALDELMPERPDLILSGVNAGQNIAEDTTFSGTIAAALFGMQHGVPSIALSQSKGFQNPKSCPWETPTAWGAKVLKPIIEKGWPDDLVINVNFPDRAPDNVAGVKFTRQGFRDERIIRTEAREDLRGNDYYWIGYRGKLSNPDEGTDLRAIYDGYISVSPLHVDLTHEAFLAEMRETWRT